MTCICHKSWGMPGIRAWYSNATASCEPNFWTLPCRSSSLTPIAAYLCGRLASNFVPGLLVHRNLLPVYDDAYRQLRNWRNFLYDKGMSDIPLGREIKEWRRLRAVELDGQGWPEVVIAEALSVNKGTVSRWLAVAKAEGVEALRSHPGAGCPPKLTVAQLRMLPDFLWHGAEAYGFRGDVWTCARIAQVIEWEFGVSYHKDHVSRLMKELGWTPQVPITRAIQRDEVARRGGHRALADGGLARVAAEGGA